MPNSDHRRLLHVGESSEDEEQNHVEVYGDEEEDDEEEDTAEEGEDDSDTVVEIQSSRVSQTGSFPSSRGITALDTPRNWVAEDEDKRRRTEGGEASSSNGVGSAEVSQGIEWNRNEMDGLFCPICMEAWTNYGDHHICCLPCGHMYGMSCIKRWLQQRKSAGKCPQCNRKCSLKDVRKLFASRIVAADEESLKRIQSLEATCASLEKKNANWCKKEVEWKNKEVALQLIVRELTERANYLEHSLEDVKTKLGVVGIDCNIQGKSVLEHNLNPRFSGQAPSCSFILEKELVVDGARILDVDASNHILLVARRKSGFGANHVLTKMSLISPYEGEDIMLPFCYNAVRDLHISPDGRNLALFASLGKKLAVLSMESNNIVLDYNLPDAAWSCSWDLKRSYHVYAGLKNGMILLFDMRQTVGPLKTLQGLTSNPVHTLHSLSNNVQSVLSASANGLCHSNFDATEEGPFLVPETNQGVCISLACCSSRDEIVASYRPKAVGVGLSSEVPYSQPSLTPLNTSGHRVEGSHVAFKKEENRHFSKLGSTHGNVDSIRLPKSAIIDLKNCRSLFVSEDAVIGELIFQELPCFGFLQSIKLPKQPVRDLKYSYAFGRGFLGCLSDDNLQILCTNL